jgi:hypothetical protein
MLAHARSVSKRPGAEPPTGGVAAAQAEPERDRDHDARAAARARYRAFAARYGQTVYYEVLRRHQAAFERAIAAGLGLAVEQAVRAHRDVDEFTVLKCAFGCRATKKVVALTVEGILPYAAGVWFASASLVFAGLAGLAAELERVQVDPRMLAIRGRLIEGREPGRVRRLVHADKKTGDQPYFVPRARRWIAIDLDSFALPPGVDPLDVRAVAEAGRAVGRS